MAVSYKKKCGYATDFRILNASDYGVLQNRKRIILIGFHGEKADFYPQIPVVKDAHKVGKFYNRWRIHSSA